MAFAYLPWCVFAIYKFLFSKNFKYLFVIIPIVSILLTSKASISLMIALSLLIFIKKDFLSLKIIPIVILTLLVSLVLINESQVFNNKFLWEHTTPEGYDNVAPGNFIFTINNDLMSNPYRDSQANSMIGILLVDTFGDYGKGSITKMHVKQSASWIIAKYKNWNTPLTRILCLFRIDAFKRAK